MAETFRIIPAGGVSLWFWGLLALMSLVILASVFFLSYSFYSSHYTTFNISPTGLKISGDLLGRFIPKEKINFSLVKALNLNQEDTLRPKRRTFGTSMPGYSSGWFRLRNGEKSLLFVTDRSKVVYIPTSAGYSVMVSVLNPNQFIQALSKIASQ